MSSTTTRTSAQGFEHEVRARRAARALLRHRPRGGLPEQEGILPSNLSPRKFRSGSISRITEKAFLRKISRFLQTYVKRAKRATRSFGLSATQRQTKNRMGSMQSTAAAQ